MRERKRIMITVDKENFDRFRVARIKSNLPADLLSRQVDKMLDAALMICDGFDQGDTSLKDKDIEQAILELIRKRLKEGRF